MVKMVSITAAMLIVVLAGTVQGKWREQKPEKDYLF
jgi:hypothetical protein